jgi:hypothetical protein
LFPSLASSAVSFDRDIQPLLADRCYSCHGPEKQKGGLRLDRQADAFAGGDNGKVIIPGKPSESLLIRNVSGLNPDSVMPPKGERLTSEQIAKLRAWIEAGAAWSSSSPNSPDSKSAHWAFQRPIRPPVPTVRNKRWVRNPIDNFVLSRLEKERLKPARDADKTTLIRRLYFDLIGLPPAPDQVRHFVADTRPDAYEQLVEDLLRSPHFGERWGRHWLDLARYADSDGYEKDGGRPYAWLFRDWVFEAINSDLPIDEFSIEQIAGDLLPGSTVRQKAGTGFHRQTLTNKEGGVDPEEFRCKATVDRATTTAAAWLGLTVGCAECHSHKYDPISHREFYQFYSFFDNVVERDVPLENDQALAKFEEQKRKWEAEQAELQTVLGSYLTNGFNTAREAWESSAPAGLPETIVAILKVPPTSRSTNQQSELSQYFRQKVDKKARSLDNTLAKHTKAQPRAPESKLPVVAENEKPHPTYIHVRGDFLRRGDQVQPGTFAILHPLKPRAEKPDRLDLARWLFDPANPLTSRVIVNRIWLHLFNRGLVNTPNDFGTRGDRPSHPELLDWLATELPRLGWSRKALIRLIVNSATYRQSSMPRPELEERDPRNVLLARQNRFRLEAEIVRDNFLACSGLLTPTIGGPSVRPPLPADITAIAYANLIKWPVSTGPDRYRRGTYIFMQRTVPYPMLVTFDAPDPNVACTRREQSDTPLQALTLLNDAVFFETAQALGKDVAAKSPLDPSTQLQTIFERCTSRFPSSAELTRLLQFYRDQKRLLESKPDEAERIAAVHGKGPEETLTTATLVAVARVVMNLDESVTRE